MPENIINIGLREDYEGDKQMRERNWGWLKGGNTPRERRISVPHRSSRRLRRHHRLSIELEHLEIEQQCHARVHREYLEHSAIKGIVNCC